MPLAPSVWFRNVPVDVKVSRYAWESHREPIEIPREVDLAPKPRIGLQEHSEVKHIVLPFQWLGQEVEVPSSCAFNRAEKN